MPCWNQSQYFSQINNTGIYILGKRGFKKLYSPIFEIQSKRFHRKFNTIFYSDSVHIEQMVSTKLYFH